MDSADEANVAINVPQPAPRSPNTLTPLAGASNGSMSTSRPTSSYTTTSAFADSAVDVDATTPMQTPDPQNEQKENYVEPDVPTEVDQSLSDRMRRLAAVAWTLEQDESMPAPKRTALHEILSQLESQLDTTTIEPLPVEEVKVAEEEIPKHTEVPESPEQQESEQDDDIWIDEEDLISVRQSLAATVHSMRLRYEEHQHLHQLTAQKLEAVAQRCLEHERRAQDLLEDLRGMRLEEDNIQQENQVLRSTLANLETEASRNEVAVEAMSSAVKGLEGWIENADPARLHTPVQEPRTKRQRVVIRGKGRFRGRYYVDEDGDEAVAFSLADAAVQQQELHDGVKSWLRGFRDMEEVVRDHDAPRSPTASRFQARIRTPDRKEADDWGDFESPISVLNT